MSNIRSLIVIPRYWPAIGGAELHTRELAKQLSKHQQIGVLHHCSNEDEQLEVAATMSKSSEFLDNGITVHQISPSKFMKLPLRQLAQHIPDRRSARKIFNKLYSSSISKEVDRIARDYDIIHSVYNGLTPSTEIALATARKQNKPFIWTPLANTEEPDGTAWSSKAFKKIYKQADALITMTAYEKEFLIQMGADHEKVHVCPVSTLLEENADGHQFREEIKAENHPLILFLGRLVEEKGYKELYASANIIWKKYPDTRFLFIGPGDKDADKFFSNITDNRIIRKEFISDIDKCSALAACDMLCVASRKESLGVIYLEAWHYKKPVVAADIPVLRTVIDDEEDGLLCIPRADYIAEAIIRLIQNPLEGQRMGETGNNKLEKLYNWERIAVTMSEIYTQALIKHNSKGSA